MESRADKAWRAAAECARLARESDRSEERDFYLRTRDAWITVANRCEFLESLERDSSLTLAHHAAT